MGKTTKRLSVVSYITWIGLLIAYFMRDRRDAMVRRHLNQALALNLIELAAGIVARFGGAFALIGGAAELAVLVLSLMGICRAVRLSDAPLPIVGSPELIR